MSTETLPNLGGRPPVEIDWNLFEQFLKISSTEKEICKFFNIAIPTLVRHIKKRYGDDVGFVDVFDRFAGERNISIRRMRFNHGKKNWNACQELCARYLGEFPLIGNDETKKGNQAITINVTGELATGTDLSAETVPVQDNQSTE
jgi:hypothetical protein